MIHTYQNVLKPSFLFISPHFSHLTSNFNRNPNPQPTSPTSKAKPAISPGSKPFSVHHKV